MFNWTALKPNQINGTVFNEIDDERVLEVSQADRTAKKTLKNLYIIKYPCLNKQLNLSLINTQVCCFIGTVQVCFD